MRSKTSMMFDRPIPGQSLTANPGGMPYEQPPQYTTEDDAMFYVLDRLSDPNVAPAIKHALDKGAYASDITNGLLLKSFSQGKFTPDMAALIAKKTLAATVATAMAQGSNIKDIKVKRPSKKQMQLAQLLAEDDPASNELTGGSTLQKMTMDDITPPDDSDPNDPMNSEHTGRPEFLEVSPRALSGKLDHEPEAPKGAMSDEY